MQRLKGKKVLVGALAILLACSGDPTGNQGTPTTISATPDVVFVTQGDSNGVIFSVLDEDGQTLQADFEPANVGSGITVVEDPTFLGVSSGNQIRRQARFYVKAVDLVSTSFDVTALGLTKTVQVTSVPGLLAATFSDTLPALGDTISITAPTGTVFSDSTEVTFAGAKAKIVSQDPTTIFFIPRPNTDGPAVVLNVGLTSNSNLVFDLATPARVKTDSVTSIGTDVTPTLPTLGQTVTLTLPAGLRVLPESIASLVIANAAAPLGIAVSADSSTITFVPPPNADSFVVVSGVVPQRLAQCCAATEITGTDTLLGYTLQLATTVKVTTPVVDSVPSTVNTTTPAVNELVTLTSTDGNFSFTAASLVLLGGGPPQPISVAADGSSITFLPFIGQAGSISVDGVDVVGFPLTLPSTAPSITTDTIVPTMAGTDNPGTAPSVAAPAIGERTAFFDTASFGYAGCGDLSGLFGATVNCQVYKFTIASDGIFDFTLQWDNIADEGLYFLASDGTSFTGNACDSGGNDGVPEECHDLALTAGTYFLAVVDFAPLYPDPSPASIGLVILAK